MRPLTTLQIIDSVAIVLCQAYQLARARLASAASPVLRLMIERDHLVTEVELLRRELAVLRNQRAGLHPSKRPDYAPEQRLAILQIMRLRGWNAKETARRFVLHPNTVRSWIKVIDGRRTSNSLLGRLPWNKIDDAVRWAVHELRRLCPEPEFGTRTIASHLIRASIQISRATVQRVLREEQPHRPRRPRLALAPPAGVEPYHLLAPELPNRVWHLDLTVLQVLWFRYTVAVLLDGFSRKLLRLQVYRRTPRSSDMVGLVRRAGRDFGMPRFLITDHGCQYRRQFKHAIEALRITHVRGRVRSASFNGKVERLFRTLRQWYRLSVLPISLRSFQRRLDRFRAWHNIAPHQALGGLTPEEVWSGTALPESTPFRAVDAQAVSIEIKRDHHGGDPRLPVFRIEAMISCAA